MLFRSIRRFICDDLCKRLVKSLVLNHIDYCSTILFGVCDFEIAKMQRVQNAAAKLVLNLKKFDSATAALKQLHWLPIKWRIKFRVACMVFKCLHNDAPEYLKELLEIEKPTRILRSNSCNDGVVSLKIPFCRRYTFYSRSFAVSGPTTWNSLPTEIRLAQNIDTFKVRFKTFYCSQA